MILLTGGTGFVGRHLSRQLVSDGLSVRVLSRAPGCVPLPESIQWCPGDLSDEASLRAALEGIDAVVHAGAALGVAPDLERVNAGGTEALARAARAAGVRRFVHVSSAGVYGDGAPQTLHRESDVPAPATPYERSKLAAERALASALEGARTVWTILRPPGLYGADRPATAALFRDVARKRIWLHGPTRVVVHPTHVSDLVAAIRIVLARDDLQGEVFNIGGERALEHSELIALIGARVGRTPLQLRAPALRTVHRAVDISKARRVLGYAPMTLEAGLDQTAAALSERSATGS